jgi:hypothetical protein
MVSLSPEDIARVAEKNRVEKDAYLENSKPSTERSYA